MAGVKPAYRQADPPLQMQGKFKRAGETPAVRKSPRLGFARLVLPEIDPGRLLAYIHRRDGFE